MPRDCENELLNPDELRSLTGFANANSQERVLKADGLPYKRRGNRVLVSRFHMREWLSGQVVTPSRDFRFDLVK